MTKRQRVGARGANCGAAMPLHLDPSGWADVDEGALPVKQRMRFLLRKRAIQLYFEGASDEVLQRTTGLKRRNVYRLIVERCLCQAEDGTLMGWRGALPYYRVKGYTRNAPLKIGLWGEGAAGSLQWIFSSPGGEELRVRFQNQILGKTSALEASRRPRQALFRWFIEELRARGFEKRGEWPFNVEKLGYVTICSYIDRVLAENPRRQREVLGGSNATRKARAGDGTSRPALKLFDRVECDAHKLDSRMVVMVPSPHGGVEPRRIHRLWVVVIIEVVSRTVLGYHLSLRKECSAEDVLRAIKRSLTLWTPRELQFSSNAYVPGAGLPSHRSPRYLGACWKEFSVDGALANVCARVEQTLRDVVGSTVLKPQDPNAFSSRRSLDDRPFIESFFRHLAKGGFHRLATTTGSSPKDKHGADPDATANATQFQLEYAEELLDTLIANYNATPHSGLGYRSPLEQLDFLSKRSPGLIRTADPGEVRRMVGIRKLCTLQGGEHTGRRPHFNFANARYSAEWLCLRTDLLGKLLWLHIEDENDARYASVSTQQGLFLGAVQAAPPWHLTPHTLYIRQAIRALEKRRLLHLSGHCDAVEELIRYAESSPGKQLPPHPAYLEARRVLQAHVQAWVEEANPTPPAPSPPPKPSRGRQASTETKTAQTPSDPGIVLPPMRKAQQW